MIGFVLGINAGFVLGALWASGAIRPKAPRAAVVDLTETLRRHR